MAYVRPTPNTDPNNFGTVDVTLDNSMSLTTIKNKIQTAGEGAVIEWAGSGVKYLLNGTLGGFRSGQKHFGDQANPPKIVCTSTAGIDSFLNLKTGTGGVPSVNVTISDLEFWGHTNVPNAVPGTAVRRVIVPWSGCFFRRVAMKGGANNGMLVSGDRVVTGMTFDTCEWSYNIHTPRAAGTCGGWKVNELGSWADSPNGEIMRVLCGRAHHNDGHGGWFDIGSSGVFIAGWESDHNQQTGLFFEVSSSLYFRDNNVHDNTENGIWIESGYQGHVLNNTATNNAFDILFQEDHDPQSRSSFTYPQLPHAGKNEGYAFPTYGDPSNPAGGAGWLVQGNVVSNPPKYRESYASGDPAGPSFTINLVSDSRIHYSTPTYVDPGGGGGGGGGVITVAEQAELADPTNSQSYSSGSFTPPANALLVVHLAVSDDSAGSTAGTILPVATGYTFTPLSGLPLNVTNVDFYQLRAWWTTTGPSPAAMTINIGTYTQNQQGGIVEVLAFTGADLTGPTNVTPDNVGNLQPSASLGSPPDANSVVVYVNQVRRNPPAWTAEAGWTQHTNIATDGPNGLSIWSKVADQSFTATGLNGQNWGFMYEVTTTPTALPITVAITKVTETDAALPFSPSIPEALANPYIVEVDFLTPLDEVPSAWTDVTAFVRGFDTRRGRNHELGKTQAGEAAVTLDNRDRRFDPTYASSPYYPNLEPMRHIRVRASTPTGGVFDLFAGFVEDWGQQWSGPNAPAQGDATCEVRLVDAFKLLNLADLVAYDVEVMSDEPLVCWPMDDAPSATLLDVAGEAHLVEKLGDASLLASGEQEGPLLGGTTSVSYEGTTNALWQTAAQTDEAYRLKDDVTAEAWVLLPTSFSTSGIMQIALFQGGEQRMAFTVDGFRRMGMNVRNEAGAFPSVTYATAFDQDVWHHLAWVRRGSYVTFYIDGAEVYRARLHLAAWGGGDVTLVVDWGEIGGQLSGGGARMSHVCIYPRALDAERIATHAATKMGSIAKGRRVDAAITDILDAISWPNTLRNITASGHTVSKHDPGPDALSALQALAEDTDAGILFVAGDGTLTFLSSDEIREHPAILASWGDQTSEPRYSDLTLRNDDEDLYPQVRASAEGLTDAVATDSTGLARYGRRTLEHSAGFLESDEQLIDRANGLMWRYHVPRTRPETLQAVSNPVYPARLDEMFVSELGRRVIVTRHPPGGGTITLRAIVEGVAHTSVEQMTQIQTTLNLVPEEDTPWILGDATYSLLGDTTALGW